MSKIVNGKFTKMCLDEKHLHAEFECNNEDFHKLLDRLYDMCGGVLINGDRVRFIFDVQEV